MPKPKLSREEILQLERIVDMLNDDPDLLDDTIELWGLNAIESEILLGVLEKLA